MTLRIFGTCILGLVLSLTLSLNFVLASAKPSIAVISSAVDPLTISPNGDFDYDETTMNTVFHLVNIGGFHGWSQSQPGHERRDFSIAWSIEIRNSEGAVVHVLEDNLLLQPADPVPAIGFDVPLPAFWDGKDSGGNVVQSGAYTLSCSEDSIS